MNLRHWRRAAGVLLGGVASIALLAACDGRNAFDPDDPFKQPQVFEISAQQGGFAGDTISVSVSAFSPMEITSITFSVRGAVTKDTTITISPSQKNVNQAIKVALPPILTDTLLFVSASVTDVTGAVSRFRSDTVVVTGPPVVLSITAPDSVRTGRTSTVRILAFSPRKIFQLDVAIRGAVTKDTVIFVNPALNTVQRDVSITLPAFVPDTALRVSVVARDLAGLSSAPRSVDLPLSVLTPVATLTAPQTVVAGGTLSLQVRGQSMRGVAKMRVEVRGFAPTGGAATTIDREVTISPAATDVTQTINIDLPVGMTDQSLTVRAFVLDAAGNSSPPSNTATVIVPSGSPIVTSIICKNCPAPDVANAGTTVDFQVSARGERPLTALVVTLRGAVNETRTIAVNPPTTGPITVDIPVPIPAATPATTLTIDVRAQDATQLGATASKTIAVADITNPTVTVSATPTSVNTGQAVFITVKATDNVELSQLGYRVHAPNGTIVSQGTVPIGSPSDKSQERVFQFNPTAAGTYTIFGFAVDRTGNTGTSTPTTITATTPGGP